MSIQSQNAMIHTPRYLLAQGLVLSLVVEDPGASLLEADKPVVAMPGTSSTILAVSEAPYSNRIAPQPSRSCGAKTTQPDQKSEQLPEPYRCPVHNFDFEPTSRTMTSGISGLELGLELGYQ